MLAQDPYRAGAQLAGPAPEPSAPVRAGGLRLPTHEQVTYTRDLMVLALFVIAFPWVLHKLLTRPAQLLQGSGVKAGL